MKSLSSHGVRIHMLPKYEVRFGAIFLLMFMMCLSLFSCGKRNNEHENSEHSEEHHHSGIEIDSVKAENLGIIKERAVKSPFREVIKTGGVLESSNSDYFTITAKKSGIVTLSSDITEGKSVNKGATIATISSQGVQGGDANKAAAVNLDAAKKEYERLKPLYEERLVTAATFQEAERAYKEAQALSTGGNSGDASSAISPIEGQITSLSVKSGDFVDVGAPIATVSKNSQLTLKAELPMRYSSILGTIESANFMTSNMDTVVSIQNLGGRLISGNSTTVATNGYIPVYFSFSGNSISYPQGYVEVFLLGKEKPGIISVPRSAIIEMQGNKYIYVVENGDDYTKRLIKTGLTDGQRVEILEGLEEGEEYVSKGATSVRMTEVSAIAPPAHNHNH